MDHEPSADAADVLADLEQQLFPEAVRRLRRRWCAAVTGSAAATVAGLALVGLRALPVLLVLLLAGGLVVVSRVTPLAGDARRRVERPVQPLGCSTKS